MRGYAHIEIFGRVGRSIDGGFELEVELPHGDRATRFPFSILERAPFPPGSIVLVAGSLLDKSVVRAQHVTVFAELPKRPGITDAQIHEFRNEEIEVDGYWQNRGGQPVWVRGHPKTVRKKLA
jgi:hypothetical protein